MRGISWLLGIVDLRGLNGMSLQIKAFFAGFQIEKIGVKNGFNSCLNAYNHGKQQHIHLFLIWRLIRLGLMLLNGKVPQLIRIDKKEGQNKGSPT